MMQSWRINYFPQNQSILEWRNWIDYTSITIAILATVGFVCFITYEKRKLREPSVEVLDAIKDSDKRVAIISSLDNAHDAIKQKSGTIIKRRV